MQGENNKNSISSNAAAGAGSPGGSSHGSSKTSARSGKMPRQGSAALYSFLEKDDFNYVDISSQPQQRPQPHQVFHQQHQEQLVFQQQSYNQQQYLRASNLPRKIRSIDSVRSDGSLGSEKTASVVSAGVRQNSPGIDLNSMFDMAAPMSAFPFNATDRPVTPPTASGGIPPLPLYTTKPSPANSHTSSLKNIIIPDFSFPLVAPGIPIIQQQQQEQQQQRQYQQQQQQQLEEQMQKQKLTPLNNFYYPAKTVPPVYSFQVNHDASGKMNVSASGLSNSTPGPGVGGSSQNVYYQQQNSRNFMYDGDSKESDSK
jgi:hypothetical protein